MSSETDYCRADGCEDPAEILIYQDMQVEVLDEDIDLGQSADLTQEQDLPLCVDHYMELVGTSHQVARTSIGSPGSGF